MKIKLIIATTILIGFYSCQPSNSDIEAKKTLLKEYKEIMSEAKDSIASLEEQIAALDTTKIQYKFQSVVTQIAKMDTFNHFIKVHGEAEATNNVLVTPEMGGTITRIHVKEGQKVSRGQLIASIDASVLQNNLAELESQLAFATTMYDKQKRLYDQNIGSEVQYLQAKNSKESIENSIKTLQSQKGKFNVKSPISGFIDDVFPNQGEAANPGMPIARVVNLDKVSIESELSEKYLGKVNLGDQVKVTFKSIGKVIPGKVIQIGQFIDEANRTFKIKIDLDEKDPLIKPNLLAVVELQDYQNTAVVIVPSKAILEDLTGKYVFVSEEENVNGKMMPVARKKYVETGKIAGGKIEIYNVEEGDQIIVEGFSDLAVGEKLMVK